MIILKDILASCGEFFPIPFAVTDFSINEQPLVYVNDPFLQLTDYKKEDVLGKNCRFLQGPKTDPKTVLNIRSSLKKRECCYFDLLNHKREGGVFWNRLALFPVGPTPDSCTYYVGIQMEVPASERQIRNFEKESVDRQISNKVKNPFTEIIDSTRSADLIFSFDNHLKYQDFVKRIAHNVQKICHYIKSI